MKVGSVQRWARGGPAWSLCAFLSERRRKGPSGKVSSSGGLGTVDGRCAVRLCPACTAHSLPHTWPAVCLRCLPGSSDGDQGAALSRAGEAAHPLSTRAGRMHCCSRCRQHTEVTTERMQARLQPARRHAPPLRTFDSRPAPFLPGPRGCSCMSRPSSRGASSWRPCCARCPSGRACSGCRSTRRLSEPWSVLCRPPAQAPGGVHHLQHARRVGLPAASLDSVRGTRMLAGTARRRMPDHASPVPAHGCPAGQGRADGDAHAAGAVQRGEVPQRCACAGQGAPRAAAAQASQPAGLPPVCLASRACAAAHGRPGVEPS